MTDLIARAEALEAEAKELRRQAAERVAALEAENAALKARIAGGVEVECALGMDGLYDTPCWGLSDSEFSALLPLDGKRVIVVEAGND